MQLFARLWKGLILGFLVSMLFLPAAVAYAQEAKFAPPSFTLLPELRTNLFPTELACNYFLDDFESEFFFGSGHTAGNGDSLFPAMGAALAKMNQTVFDGRSGIVDSANEFFIDDVLACAVKTGRIKFAYIPFFLTFLLSLGTVVSGTIAMLFVIIGGYRYIFSGVSDGKEEAKKTITYALGGMILSSFAWIIVQVVLSFLSS